MINLIRPIGGMDFTSRDWLVGVVRAADQVWHVARPPCKMAGAVFMAANRLVRLAVVVMADIATVAGQGKQGPSGLKSVLFSQHSGQCFD